MIFKRDEFLGYLRARGYAQSTVRRIEIHLDQFYGWLLSKGIRDIHAVTPGIIRGYQTYLLTDYKKPNGKKLCVLTVWAKRKAAALYFRYLSRQRDILLDPATHLHPLKLTRPMPKNILTQSEMEHFLTLPQDTWTGIRDKAILELLYSTGIRRAELCNLDVYDINLKDKILHVRYPKNRQDRIIPVGAKAGDAVEKYLSDVRPRLACKRCVNALFLSQYGRRMHNQSLNYIISVYSRKMALDKKITPHSFRHSCATHLLQNGANLAVIQKILGHSRIDTTEIYTRIVVQDLKNTIHKYHPRGKVKSVTNQRAQSIA